MKRLWVVLVLLCGCAGAPSVTERRVVPGPDAQGTLLAPESKDDLPLTHCLSEPCYSFMENDVKKIKKYIISLESQLKKCESKPKFDPEKFAPSIVERIIFVDKSVTGYLMAPKKEDDLPISVCAEDNLCYVYLDSDLMIIKKYIVQLEVRLRRCQKP